MSWAVIHLRGVFVQRRRPFTKGGEMCPNVIEDESRHQNVSGLEIILRQKRIGGKSVCMEYTVSEDSPPFWHSSKLHVLTVFIVLLAFAVHCNYLTASCILAAISLLFLYSLAWEIDQEVLLVSVPIGFQFTSKFRSGQQTSCFIPWHRVKDIYIIEAISIHRVLYNLVILTESQECDDKSKCSSKKLIPLFQGTQPRLSCLESIYRSIYKLVPPQHPN